MTRITRAQLALGLVAAAALVLAATAAARTADGARYPDRHRLGLRLEGQDGAVRRAGARCGQASREADQREGRRRRASAADQHLRHAGQQAGDREGVRHEADRTGCEHHLHDVRRRLRRTGRAGVDQRGQARPSRRASAPTRWARSASARRAGSPSASATSPRTKAPPWRSSPGTRAGGRPRSRPTPSSSTSRTSPQAFAVRFKQLGGKIVDSETYQSLGSTNVSNAVSRLNGVKADVFVTSTAGPSAQLSTLVSGLRTLGNDTPILNSWAGDGTYWLPKDPKVTNYYFVTYADAFGDDPEPGGQQARQAGQGGHGRLRHRLGRDRRRRDGDQPLARLDDRRGTRRDDGEVQEGADALGPRELLADAAHGLRAPVPRDRRSRTTFRDSSPRSSPRSSPTSRDSLAASNTARELERRPGATLRASSVSRSFAGVQALRDVTLELHRGEVVGLIGPNGAGKSTLVNVLSGFDRPTAGARRARGRDVTRWSRAPPRPRRARPHVPAQPRVPRALGARERRGRGARRRRRRAPRGRRAPTSCSGCSGSPRYADAPAAALAHGDERRLGVARALATRAALRAHGRAGRRTARGGGAGLRRGRALGARRPRRRRAADRSQHGADHGRLRPHPRARPGDDARRRARRPRSARTSTSPPPTSAKAPSTRTRSRRHDRARRRRPRGALRRRSRRPRPLARRSSPARSSA